MDKDKLLKKLLEDYSEDYAAYYEETSQGLPQGMDERIKKKLEERNKRTKLYKYLAAAAAFIVIITSSKAVLDKLSANKLVDKAETKMVTEGDKKRESVPIKTQDKAESKRESQPVASQDKTESKEENKAESMPEKGLKEFKLVSKEEKYQAGQAISLYLENNTDQEVSIANTLSISSGGEKEDYTFDQNADSFKIPANSVFHIEVNKELEAGDYLLMLQIGENQVSCSVTIE